MSTGPALGLSSAWSGSFAELHTHATNSSASAMTATAHAAVEHVGPDMVLELEVFESNAGARRLYDRLGFRTVDRTLALEVRAATEDGPTIGAVHVQNDDVEKVKRDATKVLKREP